MDVTTKNFDEILKEFPESLSRAQFVSIDTEFTGLRVDGGNSFNFFDTAKEFYEINRQTVSACLAVQYGISLFEYHPDEDRYTHRSYNFYVYPGDSKRNFTCQVSCLKFLANHGFDFNKLFGEGIPYLTQGEEEAKYEQLQARQEKQVVESPVIKIPSDQKKVLDGVMKKIRDFVAGQGSPTLPRYNSFVRRLIYQSAKDEFGEEVTLESNKDGTMNMTKGMTEEEKKAKIVQKWDREKKSIEEEVGFSKIIRMIVKSRKPLIGHNLLIDLLFTIHQFLHPLPDDFEEFREMSQELFPCVLDTKHIATSANFREFLESSLADVLNGFDKSEIPEVEPEVPEYGYKKEEAKPHQAAYDSYITGLAFLAIVGRIGKLNTTNIYKTLPTTPLLKTYMNKLSLPRMHDVTCMDLEGEYEPPSRHDVFHISFPKEWKREDILTHFKDYGFINMRWIDSTSAFIGIGKEWINGVKQLISKNKHSECKILTIVIVGLIVDPTNNGILSFDQNHSGIVYVTWPGYIVINTILIIGYVIGDRLPKRTSMMFSFLGAILYLASASVVIHDWRLNQTKPMNPRPSKQYQDMVISAAVIAILTSLIMVFETVAQALFVDDEDDD